MCPQCMEQPLAMALEPEQRVWLLTVGGSLWTFNFETLHHESGEPALDLINAQTDKVSLDKGRNIFWDNK